MMASTSAIERKPRRFVSDPVVTCDPALVAHLILSGHTPVRMAPHRRRAGMVSWTFRPETRPVAERWFAARDKVQQDAAWTLREQERRP
jgi:hypothetical protein